jgi:hypothetical protein
MNPSGSESIDQQICSQHFFFITETWQKLLHMVFLNEVRRRKISRDEFAQSSPVFKQRKGFIGNMTTSFALLIWLLTHFASKKNSWKQCSTNRLFSYKLQQ